MIILNYLFIGLLISIITTISVFYNFKQHNTNFTPKEKVSFLLKAFMGTIFIWPLTFYKGYLITKKEMKRMG